MRKLTSHVDTEYGAHISDLQRHTFHTASACTEPQIWALKSDKVQIRRQPAWLGEKLFSKIFIS